MTFYRYFAISPPCALLYVYFLTTEANTFCILITKARTEEGYHKWSFIGIIYIIILIFRIQTFLICFQIPKFLLQKVIATMIQ